MKQVSHKIVSILMAFVVLFSTLSFTMTMHYCGENLVETAFFKKAKGCGMDMEKPSFEGCSAAKKNCCNDEQLFVDGQDELQLQVDKISFEQQQFLVSFFYAYSSLFGGVETDEISFLEYPPPLIVRQLYKLDETYLI
ncbi:MAG: hypothetical protein WA775_13205 [Psychroserpens sp.]|uniref:HYC_CC_PP family protein n=1 Tax=Psychroserpens sp. TaxID=2020870 RepID=UPI003CBCAAF7